MVSYRGCPLILFSVGKSRDRPYLNDGLSAVATPRSRRLAPSMTTGLWASVYPCLEYTSMAWIVAVEVAFVCDPMTARPTSQNRPALGRRRDRRRQNQPRPRSSTYLRHVILSGAKDLARRHTRSPRGADAFNCDFRWGVSSITLREIPLLQRDAVLSADIPSATIGAT